MGNDSVTSSETTPTERIVDRSGFNAVSARARKRLETVQDRFRKFKDESKDESLEIESDDKHHLVRNLYKEFKDTAKKEGFVVKRLRDKDAAKTRYKLSVNKKK